MKKYWLILTILIIGATLRIIALDRYPAGINSDEAAIGYNAWSLIKTGKDEHSISWPLVFRSFDDYKPAIYFYLVLPFVKLIGLNPWAIRLPSAILGSASILLFYLIVRQLFPKNKSLALVSSAILATSPWHLHFSRGGWEVNASLFFILAGIWAFFKGLVAPKYYLIFTISFVISLYTYHSSRIISPLIGILLLVTFSSEILANFKDNKKALKIFLLACLVGIITTIPLFGQMLSQEGRSRFSGVSVFSDSGPLWQALEQRRNHDAENLGVKTLHNRYLSYSLRFVKNYLSHFSPRFLFVTGDEIARSKVPEMGQSYLFLAPFYFLGLLKLAKLDHKGKIFFFGWFLFSPLAAALTFQSPHALRAQNMVIPLTFITGLGLCQFTNLVFTIKNKIFHLLISLSLMVIAIYSVSRYLHLYYTHYPKQLPFAWQYGFDQVAQYVIQEYDHFDQVIISDRYDQPYILMAFYLSYDPEKLQSEMVMTPRDKFGFSTLRTMGKMKFRSINYDQDTKLKNTLIVATDESVDDSQVIHIISDPSGKPMYKILSTK